ncbi:hypothetical protein Btru_040522 [Bulinus truncatus]|nr:hypothetical protein Btru_040522 [Bulinus truncatus]
MSKKGEKQIIGFKPMVVKQELDFDPEVLTLQEIVSKYKLPKVVQCADPNTSRDQTKMVDISQPLLVYGKNSVRKVCAQNLTFDKTKKVFLPVGSDLLIPETYLGWFAVMGSPEEYTSDKAVPHFTTLAQLAASQCSSFLVGGNRPIEGIVMCKTSGKNIRFQILPGETLQKAGNYIAQYHTDEKKKKKKKKSKVPIVQEELYIKCYDHQDREIYLPFRQQGLFYIVSQNTGSLKTQIMQMSTILQKFKFPLIVTHIYGEIPKIHCEFTRTLLLTDSGMSHTVVASTLFGVNNINLEIPLSTFLKFRVASDNPGLRGCNAYIGALKTCENNAKSYIRNIKVIVGDPYLEDDAPKPELQKSRKTSSSSEGRNPLPVPSQENFPLRRSNRRSTFKELSNCLTFTDNSDSNMQDVTRYNSSVNSQECDISPILAPHRMFDPPESPHTIPIFSGSLSSQNLSQPSPIHEYDSGTLKQVSSGQGYTEIWIGESNPSNRPRPHFRMDDKGGYLLSPQYKEDLQKQATSAAQAPPAHKPVGSRSMSNPIIPISSPYSNQRLLDSKSKSFENESLSPPKSRSDYINFVPKYFSETDDLSDPVRFSQICLEGDDEVPPPVPTRCDDTPPPVPPRNDDTPPPVPSRRLTNEPDYFMFPLYSEASKLDPADNNPYLKPDSFKICGVEMDSPETFIYRKGSNRYAESNIADSGIYVEEDSIKDENENITGGCMDPGGYIALNDAIPMLTSSDATQYYPGNFPVAKCPTERLSPPPTPAKTITMANHLNMLNKKNQLIKELKNSGFVSKKLEIAIKNLQTDEITELLTKKNDIDLLLKKTLPDIAVSDYSSIAQCISRLQAQM